MHQLLHPHHNTENATDLVHHITEDDADLVTKSDETDAIYVALIFVDTIFTYAQGIMVFAFFGLESQFVYQPLLKWFNTVQNLYYEPPSEISGDGDPRLYHWTLKFAEKILRVLPKPETENPEIQFRTSSTYNVNYDPTNQTRMSYMSGSFSRGSIIM